MHLDLEQRCAVFVHGRMHHCHFSPLYNRAKYVPLEWRTRHSRRLEPTARSKSSWRVVCFVIVCSRAHARPHTLLYTYYAWALGSRSGSEKHPMNCVRNRKPLSKITAPTKYLSQHDKYIWFCRCASFCVTIYISHSAGILNSHKDAVRGRAKREERFLEREESLISHGG